MSARIRWVKPNQVYESSIRTVDRTFLFKPNHNPKNPLLRDTCPLDALSPNNDIIPEPSIIDIIGSSVGRALEKNPNQIHCFEANISHLHEEFSATEHQVDNVSAFFRTAHSLLARGVNRTWEREGHVFAGRARTHECVDNAAAEQKLLYAVTNPVKDGLIETTCKDERKKSGKTVLGKAGLHAIDPRERPKNPNKSGKRPLCHASDPELAKEYKKQWRKFMEQYIDASADYRRGYFEREFSSGSYRPPLVTIYHASGT